MQFRVFACRRHDCLPGLVDWNTQDRTREQRECRYLPSLHQFPHPNGFTLDELDVQERLGADPLEPDAASAVDQERAVQRRVLEVVVTAVGS